MVKLYDNDKKIMELRYMENGALLIKGKRQIHLLYKSVNQGKKAEKIISEFSFNKIFSKGKKLKILGSNVAYLKFK